MKNYHLGYFVVRLALGLNLFLHGYVRLAHNLETFVATTAAPFAASPLPLELASSFLRIVPFAECAIGLLLLLGLFTRTALLAGSLVMMMLLVGTCLLERWDVAGLQMTYILFYAFLLYREGDNAYSFDRKLRPRRFLPEMAAETQ